MELKGSKTEANLMAAYAGESQANTKYTIFASRARSGGFQQIAEIFDQTAHNEKEHAEIWANYLGWIGDTAANLTAASAGEHYEWAQMYATFAKEAREEGFTEIATRFEMIAQIEHHHEDRYNTLSANLADGQVFSRPDTQYWLCRNCGHIHTGTSAPDICPVCSHAKAYFEIMPDHY